MTRIQAIEKANTLGTEAHAAGIKAPVQHKELMTLAIAHKDTGSLNDFFKSWISGWSQAQYDATPV